MQGKSLKTSQRPQKPRQGDQLIHRRYTKSSPQCVYVYECAYAGVYRCEYVCVYVCVCVCACLSVCHIADSFNKLSHPTRFAISLGRSSLTLSLLQRSMAHINSSIRPPLVRPTGRPLSLRQKRCLPNRLGGSHALGRTYNRTEYRQVYK